MPTVLVTGVRAPAALELCRHFAASGWRVAAADSMMFPLGRFSRAVSSFHRLASPRARPEQFTAQVVDIVRAEQVELIVPACEEIFHLAALREKLPTSATLFAETSDKLLALHDKARFAALARNCGAEIPPGALVRGVRELDDAFAAWPELVLKPVYSRFASRALIRPTRDRAIAALAHARDVWLAQRYIAGDEVCSYAIAHGGRVVAHVCYHPRLRAGRGAGVYFDPIDAKDVRQFVATFVARERLTGQIAFDFIRSSAGALFVLECNPRATSGAHLFAPGVLADAIARGTPAEPQRTPAMLGVACTTFALSQLVREREPWKLLRRAREVVGSTRDPLPFALQPLALAELVARAVQHRESLLAASTRDIEWNGRDDRGLGVASESAERAAIPFL